MAWNAGKVNEIEMPRNCEAGQVAFGSCAMVTYPLPLDDSPINAIRFWLAMFLSSLFSVMNPNGCSEEKARCER